MGRKREFRSRWELSAQNDSCWIAQLGETRSAVCISPRRQIVGVTCFLQLGFFDLTAELRAMINDAQLACKIAYPIERIGAQRERRDSAKRSSVI